LTTSRFLTAATGRRRSQNGRASHNPFIVNDIVFACETGFPVERMNNFGSSLVFGHPQGPTGTRLIIELIEVLIVRGGGFGLYHGCAAGDAGFAVVIEMDDRPAV